MLQIRRFNSGAAMTERVVSCILSAVIMHTGEAILPDVAEVCYLNDRFPMLWKLAGPGLQTAALKALRRALGVVLGAESGASGRLVDLLLRPLVFTSAGCATQLGVLLLRWPCSNCVKSGSGARYRRAPKRLGLISAVAAWSGVWRVLSGVGPAVPLRRPGATAARILFNGPGPNFRLCHRATAAPTEWVR